MAEQDYADPSQLFFSIYEVKESNQIKCVTPRIRIDVQTEEDNIDVNQIDEESKIARGPRTNQEFSSAAASSPNIIRA